MSQYHNSHCHLNHLLSTCPLSSTCHRATGSTSLLPLHNSLPRFRVLLAPGLIGQPQLAAGAVEPRRALAMGDVLHRFDRAVGPATHKKTGGLQNTHMLWLVLGIPSGECGTYATLMQHHVMHLLPNFPKIRNSATSIFVTKIRFL